MDRLFTNFSQVDASTTRKNDGTGLGLVISKQLAELMGGRIGAESVAGNGSTFWFTVAAPCEGPRRRRPAASQGRIARIEVLVIDESPSSAGFLCEQLQSWGMQAIPVSSGLRRTSR
jgi:hypothetical protein